MKVTLKAVDNSITVDFTEGALCVQHEKELVNSPQLMELLRKTIDVLPVQPASRVFRKPEPVAAVWMEVFLASGADRENLKEKINSDINEALDKEGTNFDKVYRICRALKNEGMDAVSALHHDEKPSHIRARLETGLEKLIRNLRHRVIIDNEIEEIGPEMRTGFLYVPGGGPETPKLLKMDVKRKFSASNVIPDGALASWLRLLNVSSDEYKTVLREADRYSWDSEWEALNVQKDENFSELLSATDAVKMMDKADAGSIPALAFRASVREIAEAEWGEGRALRLRGRKETRCIAGLFSTKLYCFTAYKEVIPGEIFLPANSEKFLVNSGFLSAVFREITPKAGLETNVRGVPQPTADNKPAFRM